MTKQWAIPEGCEELTDQLFKLKGMDYHGKEFNRIERSSREYVNDVVKKFREKKPIIGAC